MAHGHRHHHEEDAEAQEGEPTETEHRIVVGVDGSSCTEHVLESAAQQAELSGAELDLVVAWEWPTTYGWAGPMPQEFDPSADAKVLVEEAAVKVLEKHPKVRVTSHVVEGHPAPVLLHMAERAELLVVGSRGHGEFTGMLLGSVSAHCVAHAACPVMVIRSKNK